jgi:SAM-dependent methyltransferase
LQSWRIRKAIPYIGKDHVVLDIGSADGALFKHSGVARRVAGGVGIDPDATPVTAGKFRMVRGFFPDALPVDQQFGTITMLAVLEHIPTEQQPGVARSCFDRTLPGGRLVITVPGPMVDRIIDVLRTIRVIDGMSVEQHYGFDPRSTIPLFQDAGYALVAAKKFQLGVNHLYVFAKDAGSDVGRNS